MGEDQQARWRCREGVPCKVAVGCAGVQGQVPGLLQKGCPNSFGGSRERLPRYLCKLQVHAFGKGHQECVLQWQERWQRNLPRPTSRWLARTGEGTTSSSQEGNLRICRGSPPLLAGFEGAPRERWLAGIQVGTRFILSSQSQPFAGNPQNPCIVDDLEGVVVPNLLDSAFQRSALALELATNHVHEFIFRGREVKQRPGSGHVDVAMKNYALSMKPVRVDSIRRKQLMSELEPEEKKKFQSHAGELGWLARQLRCDLAYENGVIQRCKADVCVADMLKLKQYVGQARRGADFRLRYTGAMSTCTRQSSFTWLTPAMPTARPTTRRR